MLRQRKTLGVTIHFVFVEIKFGLSLFGLSVGLKWIVNVSSAFFA